MEGTKTSNLGLNEQVLHALHEAEGSCEAKLLKGTNGTVYIYINTE